LASGRPVSTDWFEVTRETSGFVYEPENSARPAAGVDGGGGGESRNILGGRSADFGVFQIDPADEAPVDLALAASAGSSWERWRLAGEFLFSVPDWPAGRRRSQEVQGSRSSVKMPPLRLKSA
jgi:hypothetical protein